MNELGDYSRTAHEEVGAYCKSDKLDLVVTIGPDAAKFLAPAARAAGCKVKTFDSPYLAGTYVREHLQKEAVVLAEGSQNRVFAEESLKSLLADKLKSPSWCARLPIGCASKTGSLVRLRKSDD